MRRWRRATIEKLTFLYVECLADNIRPPLPVRHTYSIRVSYRPLNSRTFFETIIKYAKKLTVFFGWRILSFMWSGRDCHTWSFIYSLHSVASAGPRGVPRLKKPWNIATSFSYTIFNYKIHIPTPLSILIDNPGYAHQRSSSSELISTNDDENTQPDEGDESTHQDDEDDTHTDNEDDTDAPPNGLYSPLSAVLGLPSCFFLHDKSF